MTTKMQNDNNDVVADVALCPSFSAYFSDRQAIAARVIYEASRDSPPPQSELDEDRFGFAPYGFQNRDSAGDDFEFEVLCSDSSIGEIFPMFNSGAVAASASSLGKLFVEEERDWASSSSEESDECVRKEKRSPSHQDVLPSGKCKKGKSTGSTIWKLCDLLLRRCSSHGNKKKSFVFPLTPSPSSTSTSSPNPKVKRASGECKCKMTSENELFYGKNRAVKEEVDKRRKSYLPYKNGILRFGFFPNGLSFTGFRPF